MVKSLLLVGFGGALGSIFRYLTSIYTLKLTSSVWPWATFLVNIIGCLLIGIGIGWIERNTLSDNSFKHLFITGFCGGFTTFSTLALENIKIYNSGNYLIAIIYTLTSIVFGFIAVLFGLYITK